MDIKHITDTIEQKKCILVLGPDIAFNSEKSLLKELSNFLQTNGYKHQFHDDEELFSSTSNFKHGGFRLFPQFFNALKTNKTYQQIAEIPFHLIISLSPDLLLKQTFDKNNFDYSFDYYQKQKPRKEIEKPNNKKPLLYNLLGTQMESTSLILCFNHLFDYLSSILGKFELPSKLRTELDDAWTIYFLGFKYDKWYFKLIMRLLNKDGEVQRQASFKGENHGNNIINFYKDEFHFVFEEELTGTEIIKQIHNYFAENNSLRKPKDNALRKPKEEDATTVNKTTNVINVNKGSTVGNIYQGVKTNDTNNKK